MLGIMEIDTVPINGLCHAINHWYHDLCNTEINVEIVSLQNIIKILDTLPRDYVRMHKCHWNLLCQLLHMLTAT